MTIELENLDKSIQDGVSYLYERQLPTGEFISYYSEQPNMETGCLPDSSSFPTALISYSIKFVDSPKVPRMLDKATKFLLSQVEMGGLWRYWTYKHPLHSFIPVDTDDSACVSIVLRQNEVRFPDNRKLLLANRNLRGLFYTWFVPRLSLSINVMYWLVVLKSAVNPISLHYFWKRNQARPNDVDGVVNANSVFYLGNIPETQAAIDYLIEIIENGREEYCDKWHHSAFNLYYSVSRNLYAKMEQFRRVRDVIIDRIQARCNADGSIGKNALETALAACSLLNLGCYSQALLNAVEFLLTEQLESGAWKTFPMYYAGRIYNGPDHYFGWGSEDLTTGFCLEALSRVRTVVAPQANHECVSGEAVR